MKTVSAAVLAVVVLAWAGSANAQDDNAKKIVGTWVVEKSSGELPAGTTIEFTKDGKLKVVVKSDGAELKFDGSYSVAKEKLTVKLKVGEESIEETATIKKLTDDTLEIEDKDKKVDTFKKKK